MPNQSPLPYESSIEVVPHDEAQTTQGLIETMRQISEITLKDEGHPIRSVHAKSHALLQGELEVLAGFDPTLAQGLFTAPGRYPAVLRFSTIPGDLLDDSVSAPRAVAVKLIGVPGERLSGEEEEATQDFIMINGPAFGAPTPKAFLANLKLLAGTTDKAQGLKKILSAVMQGVQAAIVAAGGKPSPLVATLGGQPETHILGETFFSQTPLRWGDYVAKVRLMPVSPELTALTNKHLKINGVPNALRDACIAFFRDHAGVWELQAQLWTDRDRMPIEDASKVWDEAISPYVTVARLSVGPQVAWSEARSQAVDDGMSFSAWHCLAAHRPLGGVNRARRTTYEAGRRFRAEHGRPILEPRDATLPS
ncbi:MAG: catalase family protein [Caulobacteraceae bacterium]|nr:catalase family protein [Caulobacteraceae bacterium]